MLDSLGSILGIYADNAMMVVQLCLGQDQDVGPLCNNWLQWQSIHTVLTLTESSSCLFFQDPVFQEC